MSLLRSLKTQFHKPHISRECLTRNDTQRTGHAPRSDGQSRHSRLVGRSELDVPGKAALQGVYEPDLVWQFYNPYPTLQEEGLNQLAIFIDEDAPGVDEGKALNSESMITSGMNEVLTLYTGAVRGKEDSDLKHTPLLTTGDQSGLFHYQPWWIYLVPKAAQPSTQPGIASALPVCCSSH